MPTNFAKWKRREFEPGTLDSNAEQRRAEAEKQTNRDLKKPIQQLICDVHEASLAPRTADDKRLHDMVSRMVGMMGRVALEQDQLGPEYSWWRSCGARTGTERDFGKKMRKRMEKPPSAPSKSGDGYWPKVQAGMH